MIALYRDLEQYIDEVVSLHTQQTNNEDVAMDRIESKVRQSRPKER